MKIKEQLTKGQLKMQEIKKIRKKKEKEIRKIEKRDEEISTYALEKICFNCGKNLKPHECLYYFEHEYSSALKFFIICKSCGYEYYSLNVDRNLINKYIKKEK